MHRVPDAVFSSSSSSVAHALQNAHNVLVSQARTGNIHSSCSSVAGGPLVAKLADLGASNNTIVTCNDCDGHILCHAEPSIISVICCCLAVSLAASALQPSHNMSTPAQTSVLTVLAVAAGLSRVIKTTTHRTTRTVGTM